MRSVIIETYNNVVIPHGSHIYKTAIYMFMLTNVSFSMVETFFVPMEVCVAIL